MEHNFLVPKNLIFAIYTMYERQRKGKEKRDKKKFIFELLYLMKITVNNFQPYISVPTKYQFFGSIISP